MLFRSRGRSIRVHNVITHGIKGIPEDGEIAFYGVDEKTLPIWNMVKQRGQDFFYVDNSYFNSKWKGGDYYRITKNAMQHMGDGASDGRRWGALHLGVRNVIERGDTVLLALQSDFWYSRFNMTKADFVAAVKHDLKPYLGRRRLLVRDKSEHTKPIHWDDICCVVAHSSNVAVDGLLEGVPCFVTYPCAAATMAGQYPRVDEPRRVRLNELLPWCWSLADNQFTISEIKQGLPFEVL